MKGSSLLILSVGIALISSCKKDDSSSPSTPVPNHVPNTVPAISTASGIMVAVRTNHWVAGVNQPIGSSVALFYSSPGGPNTVDAGTVNCKDSLLAKQSDNIYSYTPTVDNASGIVWNTGNAKWTVSGNSANLISPINFTTTVSFPTIDSVSNINTVNTALSLIVAPSGAIMNAESVIYIVAGPNGEVKKTVAAGIASVTFSATELGTVGKGAGVITIAPYRSQQQTVGGKVYYFINESIATKSITLQ